MITRTAATQTLESTVTKTEISSGNAVEHNTPPLPSPRRRLGQSLGTTPTPTTTSGDDDANNPNDLNVDDADDDDYPQNNPTSSSSTNNNNNNGTNNMVFTPMGECELCPHNWRMSIERDDEKIKGEYESCVKYGRRRQFECTVLYQENDSSEKIARNLREYRSCQYTEQDEIYRILRMQIICILVGMWSMRNVLRQRVVSASLFDQRRMRLAASHNNSNNNNNGFNTKSNNSKKYATSLQSQDSMETVELIPMNGRGKVPKSPAPDPNFQTV
eukprot:CAMPEP_0201659176 /NCGR_PEP_ID=MMETSP0494-20130426/2023_1 /ASSEMBLY_ACC=CAM_ASM_000839 /TAXON_ID=420259 /ORGANISM="Thalassiosira gravida, Strain GMp14c1" /LENGTH=272 /DNA_ID=CAMNT_0048136573 /DNA_START=71 /DNA_END=889 /DNA_ORIENTATION=+